MQIKITIITQTAELELILVHTITNDVIIVMLI